MEIHYHVVYRNTKDRYKTRWELLPVTVDTFTGLDEAISDYLTGYAHLQYEYCLEVINGAAINPKERSVRFIDLETMAQERVIEDAATRRAELSREAVR
jgi:hypothetical protein